MGTLESRSERLVRWVCAFFEVRRAEDPLTRSDFLFSVSVFFGERHRESIQRIADPPIYYVVELRFVPLGRIMHVALR
jgi:hypothetical protein